MNSAACFACLPEDQKQTLKLQLLCEIYDAGGGATDRNLRAWTASEAYTLTSASYDVDLVITTATVSWPDGSSGTYTTVTKNPTWLTVDAYTVTHVDSGKTATQPLVTRDVNGNVTAQPAIIITP